MCGVSVTCPGGVAWVESVRPCVCVCVCVCVWGGGVGVWCIAATGGPCGRHGCVRVASACGCGGRDRGRETQPGKGQRSVCVGGAGRGWWGWVVCGRCEGPCVCVGGMGVCVWRPPVGAGAETEAERHSQAKDNKVCVLGGRGGGGGGGWCVAGVKGPACVWAGCVCGVGGMGVCVWRAPVDAGLGGRGVGGGGVGGEGWGGWSREGRGLGWGVWGCGCGVGRVSVCWGGRARQC